MAHPNARLTPVTRLEPVRELEAGYSQGEVARRFRVSRATVAKWLRRFREEGAAGLEDRAAKPRRNSPMRAMKFSASVRTICVVTTAAASSVSVTESARWCSGSRGFHSAI